MCTLSGLWICANRPLQVTMLWSYGRMARGRRPSTVQAHIDALAAALTQHLGGPSEDGWVTLAQSAA